MPKGLPIFERAKKAKFLSFRSRCEYFNVLYREWRRFGRPIGSAVYWQVLRR